MQVLTNQIRHCKICFSEIKDYSLYNFINKKNDICESCFNKFNPRFYHFNIGPIFALAIYPYDQCIKELLYKFKGCYDIVLKDIFFPRFLWYFKLKYRGFYIVPVPSYHLEDKRRGFNHVVEMFSRLDLPMLKVIVKTKDHKQAKLSKKKRISSQKNFDIIDLDIIKGKKILIVDDVYTTGSSMRAAIELCKRGNPKRIEVLVMSKNILKEKK